MSHALSREYNYSHLRFIFFDSDLLIVAFEILHCIDRKDENKLKEEEKRLKRAATETWWFSIFQLIESSGQRHLGTFRKRWKLSRTFAREQSRCIISTLVNIRRMFPRCTEGGERKLGENHVEFIDKISRYSPWAMSEMKKKDTWYRIPHTSLIHCDEAILRAFYRGDSLYTCSPRRCVKVSTTRLRSM